MKINKNGLIKLTKEELQAISTTTKILSDLSDIVEEEPDFEFANGDDELTDLFKISELLSEYLI